VDERPVDRKHEDHDRDHARGERRHPASAHAPHLVCPCVTVPWSPGTFPTIVLPTRKSSFAASHSGVCPGESVFGYGFEWRWFSVVGPFAGALDGPPSLFGPCGVATMMKRCHVPFLSPSDRWLAMLRNQR